MLWHQPLCRVAVFQCPEALAQTAVIGQLDLLGPTALEMTGGLLDKSRLLVLSILHCPVSWDQTSWRVPSELVRAAI